LSAIPKYLARYAEPEQEFAVLVRSKHAAVLVVPALGEAKALLDGFRAAARGALGRVLLVLVVNATVDGAPELRRANDRLLGALGGAPGPGARYFSDAEFDVLLVDRSSPGRELPPKQGVGLARKIGMDVALALWARGGIDSPWIFATDADATLPEDYFRQAESSDARAAALLFPFRHVGPESAETDATLRYEAALRYHVLGLAAAGSPYAHHSIGSTMAVRGEAYAVVRGVPKREAAEDFYLLDKLAKIGAIQRLSGGAIEIAARRSGRVPFGTGRRVSELLGGEELAVASPRAFASLRAVLGAIERFAGGGNEFALREELALAAPNELPRGSVESTLEAAGIFAICRESAREVRGATLRRRLSTWFDGLRTLRFLHALRDAGLYDIPLATALRTAPFTPDVPLAPIGECLHRLRELEAALPALRSVE